MHASAVTIGFDITKNRKLERPYDLQVWGRFVFYFKTLAPLIWIGKIYVQPSVAKINARPEVYYLIKEILVKYLKK